ncbi:MAG TPA: hypothetical protein PKD90_05375 [Phnomibacter sp.]|nr:hypothetical protein [Phnomibacter sp.]
MFTDGYTLQSLEETEAFINANKHLPCIPSAAEIESQGFGLANMQMQMMEKL